jgi:hypothetical protein
MINRFNLSNKCPLCRAEPKHIIVIRTNNNSNDSNSSNDTNQTQNNDNNRTVECLGNAFGFTIYSRPINSDHPIMDRVKQVVFTSGSFLMNILPVIPMLLVAGIAFAVMGTFALSLVTITTILCLPLSIRRSFRRKTCYIIITPDSFVEISRDGFLKGNLY